MLACAQRVSDCCAVKHTIDLDRENQWAVIRYHGEVAIEDALEVMRRLVAMPGWTPHCDRIVVYDDGLLGGITAEDFRRVRNDLVAFIAEHYGDTPNYSAQVCGNAIQKPLVEYWVNFGRDAYAPGLKLFDTVTAAKTWLRRMRASEAGAT
jgi:hypothetical protein